MTYTCRTPFLLWDIVDNPDPILPAQLANHNVGFGYHSCLLVTVYDK